MLTNLYIENIAVAKQLSIDFSRGFSVLTGETGAGKSIVADCLGLLIGNKATRDMIRSGEDHAVVSGIFCVDADKYDVLTKLGFPPDENGELLITRTITADGKSTAKCNRRGVTLASLREAGAFLINIHGQGESIFLTDTAFHAEILDEFSEIGKDLLEYRAAYAEYSNIRDKISRFKQDISEQEMMLDILKYQLKEIDSAKLSDLDEEDKLRMMRSKLKNYEQIGKLVAIIKRSLVDSEKGNAAVHQLVRAAKAVEALTPVLPEGSEISAKLDTMRYELEDIAEKCADIIDDSISDPERQLDAVETRLALIEKLERKYGACIADIIKKRDSLREKLNNLQSSEDTLNDLENNLNICYNKARLLADTLSKKRQTSAVAVSKKITDTLSYLDMPKVRFVVSVTQATDKNGNLLLSSTGYDNTEFLISTNPGDEPKPLSKIASGGELSRVLLALKSELSGKNGAETVVFDEIDTGISGATSEKVGCKLKELSRFSQIICVTHSPQIASIADTHLFVSKAEHDGRNESAVRVLTYAERIDEIARIIGGVTVTQAQRTAAEELLNNNKIPNDQA